MMSIVQAGAILISQGDVLLRYTPGRPDPDRPDPGAHTWTFPKGHVEPGEAPVLTAQRELLEETGVEGRAEAYVCRLPYYRRGRAYDLRLYRFALVCETEAARRHIGFDAHWVSIDEARRCLTFPEYRDALDNSLNAMSNESMPSLAAVSADAERITAELLGRSVELIPISSAKARRPSFRIRDEPLKVRVFQSDHEARRCAHILELATSLPVPRVVAQGGHILVKTWIDGRPIAQSPIPRHRLLQGAAELLARIHSLPVSAADRQAAVFNTLTYLDECYTTSVDQLTDAGFVTADAAAALIRLYEISRPSSPEITVVHWDFVPYNLLWSDGHITVVDFESSRLFVPEYDVTKACHFIASNKEERDFFLSAYTTSRTTAFPDPNANFWELFFLVRNSANRIRSGHLGFAERFNQLSRLLHG